MPHLILILCAVLAALALPHSAFAQDRTTTASAADEAKFRVIKRFDVTEPAALTIAPVEWPFGADTRAAVERRDWQAAWSGIAKSEPRELSPDFAFLAGYVAFEAGQPQAAPPFLDRAKDSETLEPLAHLFAARAAQTEKAWEIAAAEAARVGNDSLYGDDASHILSRALLESGRADDALRAARALSRDGDADGLLVHADALVARGNDDDLVSAARLYQKVAQRFPNTENERVARTSYEALAPRLSAQARTETALDDLDDDAVLARYTHLFDRHRSKTVVSELPGKIANWKKGTDARCDALYLIAKSHTKLRDHAESLPWYAKLSTECSGSHRRRGYYLGGRGAWNAGEKATALAIFARLVKEYPKHSYADDALYFSARILREQGKGGEARKMLERQVAAYPDGDMAKDAHWLIVREHFAKSEHDAVVRYVDGLRETGEHDLYSQGRLAYFRARALQLSNRGAEAAQGFRDVVKAHPTGYYALLAFNRLAELEEGSSKGRGNNVCAAHPGVCDGLKPLSGKPISIPKKLREDARFDQGLALVRIGLDGLAGKPFAALSRDLGDDDETRWALAFLLDRAGAYPLSHNIVRREIEGWVDGYPLPSNPAATRRWSIAYPRPFDELVTKWSNTRGLPAELIWAIMREESGFTPGIESWANARGLMQLMPGTARVVAKADGMGSVATRRLFEPDVAVRLGSAYMADLSQKVSGHPALIIAGYNGGWGNVSRWLDETKTRDFDLFVEDIPYGQTRKYTKRVLSTYWAYHWADSGAVVPRIPMSI
jgi:soluble lytic murein transglycosylase